MSVNRRSLLKYSAALPLASVAPGLARAADNPASSEKVDYTIRIATGLVELSPEHIVSTTLYNGQFPGPLLRLLRARSNHPAGKRKDQTQDHPKPSVASPQTSRVTSTMMRQTLS
jgi:hypothetical protein